MTRRHATFLAGVRMPLREAPSPVRAAVADLLGENVVGIADVQGGMSASPAAVVTGANGARAFVKACGRSTNPQTFALYEAELPTALQVDGLVNTPRLIGTRRPVVPVPGGASDDWVVIAYEASTGRCPDTPWRDDDLRRVLDAWQETAAELQRRPGPRADVGLPGILQHWDDIAADPSDPWHRWAGHWLPRVQRLRAQLDAAEQVASHTDLRSDNILLEPERVLFADWTHVYRAPAWVDPAILLLEVVASRDGSAIPGWVLEHPALIGAPAGAVDAFVAGLAAFMHRRVGVARPDMPWNPAWKRTMAAATEPFLAAPAGV